MKSSEEKIKDSIKALSSFGMTVSQFGENIKKASIQFKKVINKRGSAFEILKRNGLLK